MPIRPGAASRPRRCRCRESQARSTWTSGSSSARAMEGSIGPISWPAATISGSSRTGTPSCSHMARSQPPVCASTICVVVAFVYSATGRPRQEEVQQIGDEQQPVGAWIHAGMLVRYELIERVERQALDPGSGRDLLARDHGKHAFHHARGPRVPIADRVFHELARAIDEAVVHGPTVDADACDGASECAGTRATCAKPRAYLVEHPADVPPEVSRRPCGAGSGSAGPPRGAARRRRGRRGRHARCPPRDRPRGRAPDPRGPQRRKPSCRPPSTGTTCPVVLLRRRDTSRKIASAWSSGSIAACVSVRFA